MQNNYKEIVKYILIYTHIYIYIYISNAQQSCDPATALVSCVASAGGAVVVIPPSSKNEITEQINEKAIIGFASFFMMVAFGIVDLVTGLDGTDLVISDFIYTSFVVVTLGSFGIAEAGKAFSSKQ